MKAKKMIVPILMGVLMAFAILPMTAGKAYAAEEYDLWVYTEQVTSDNALDILGNKTVSYDAESKTLTLNGVTIPEDNSTGILSKIPDLKIEVHGENKLSGQDIGIYSLQNLTITGEGSLEAEGLRYGIYSSDGDITITDATVSATGTDIYSIGIEATGEIKIEGRSKVQAKGSYYAIFCDSGITLGGGHAITEPVNGRISDDGYYIVDQAGQKAASVTIERVVKMSGDGTEASPYEITKYADLNEFAAIVNGTHSKAPKNTAAYGKLMNDITCDDKMWVPIGKDLDHSYIGCFDGNNKVIEGLSNEEQPDVSSADHQGLFGYIGKQDDTVKGEVKNVGLEGGKIIGRDYVGGVVGYNQGGTITNCYNTGAVSGTGYVGGVVGWNVDGTITNCCNTGLVSGSNNVGGVAGYNYATANNKGEKLANCYNTGSVSGSGINVGGVAGYNNGGTITNCYNTGEVSVGGSYVGGVAGFNDGTITNCYNSGAVSGSLYVGGVVGYSVVGYNSRTITNCYYDKVFCTVTVPIGNNYGTVTNVQGLTTSDMTGIYAIGENHMAFSYTDPSKNPWLTKANAKDADIDAYCCFYPHLKGFAYDSTESAADWPAKVVFGVTWKEPSSYTYEASTTKRPEVTQITVSQKPLVIPEGATKVTYSVKTETGWSEPEDVAPTDPGSYKMTIKDRDKVIDEIEFIVLEPTDYTVAYYQQTGTDNETGKPIWSTGTVLPVDVGTYKAVVTVTRAGGIVLPEKVFQITQAEPIITTRPTASAITEGQSLGESRFSGGLAKAGDTEVPGTFAWTNSTVKPKASDSGKTEYEVTFTPEDAVNYKTVTTKITLTVNSSESPVTSTSIDNAPVVLDDAPLIYTGQPVMPVIRTIGGKTLDPDKDYTVRYTQGDTLIEAPTDAGTYTMTITGKGNFAGSTSTEFTIEKADGTLTAQGNKVKARSKTIKLKKPKKISAEKAYTIEGVIGDLAFSKVKANKKAGKFKVNATTGQIKVKKGLKKGKYELTVLISDPGDKNHETAEAEAIVTIRIRK